MVVFQMKKIFFIYQIAKSTAYYALCERAFKVYLVNAAHKRKRILSCRPDWAIFCPLGNFSKPVAAIILPKLSTLLGNFCIGVKISYFSSELIFGQLL